MTTIRPYRPSDRQAWDDFVQSHPEGTIFHTRSWQDAVGSTFGHKEQSLVAVDSGSGQEKLTGILPLFRIKSLLFGKFLVSVPFAELGGPLAGHEQCSLDLITRAERIVREHGLDYLELRNRRPLPDLPGKDLYFGFEREILPELEDNLLAIPRKSRRMVRQGIKNNLQMETGDHLLPRFYSILARNFHGLGTPVFSYSWFASLLKAFEDQALVLLVRQENGEYIAGVLSFFFRDRVLPYYAGSLIQYRGLAPNDFMYWKLLEYSLERGYKVFDFGRSKKDTGSFSFKTHWGFEPKPLSYQYILHGIKELPDISPSNPRYQARIKMWRKMPLGLTRVIGPMVSKYLC